MDLATGHQLFGLALVYDWCYDDLDDDARRQIRETLVKRTSAMFEAAATGKVWWRESYLQNHLWVNITGMAVGGLALFDEVDDAACWIGLPLDKFRRTMAALGPDGASHEGVGYWEYGVEYMLKFMDLARSCSTWTSTTRLVAQHGRLCPVPGAAAQRLDAATTASSTSPTARGATGTARSTCCAAWPRRFDDGHAQWLARQIDEANVAAGRGRPG